MPTDPPYPVNPPETPILDGVPTTPDGRGTVCEPDHPLPPPEMPPYYMPPFQDWVPLNEHEADQGFWNDAMNVAEIINESWSLGPGHEVKVIYQPESMMTDARVGTIYVALTYYYDKVSTIDYRTTERQTHVSVRVSNRTMGNHMLWCGEVRRILYDWRRAGKERLRGYTYLEVPTVDHLNAENGWYTTVFNVVLHSYNTPIRSPGFGHRRKKPCLQ